MPPAVAEGSRERAIDSDKTERVDSDKTERVDSDKTERVVCLPTGSMWHIACVFRDLSVTGNILVC